MFAKIRQAPPISDPAFSADMDIEFYPSLILHLS